MPIHNTVTLYITAVSDMRLELDAMTRTIADIPVDIEWHILHTPDGNTPVDLDALVNADIHVVLLGGDIRAPMGYEWNLIQRQGKDALYVRSLRLPLTPAATGFLRQVAVNVDWHPVTEVSELRWVILTSIVGYIQRNADVLALTVRELAHLQTWWAQIKKSTYEYTQVSTRQTLEQDSVILSGKSAATKGGVEIDKTHRSNL